MGIDQNMDIVMKPRGGSSKLLKEKLSTVGKFSVVWIVAISESFPNFFLR